MKTAAITTSLMLGLSLLVGCSDASQSTPPSQSTASTASASSSSLPFHIGDSIREGIEQGKQELLTKNIGVNNVHVGHDSHSRSDNLPKAEITPQGQLLIAGKQVDATPAQHERLLDYRQHLIGIAMAGMDIGMQGADLGMSATKQALLAVFSGAKEADIDKAIKPQTDKIEAAALGLCKRMPDLLTSQQQLAAAMPAFRPYATMQQKDVDDCAKNISDHNGKHGVAVFSE